MAVQKPSAKKAPAKKTASSRQPAVSAKEDTAKARNRSDASKATPKKGKYFYDTPLGKLVTVSSPILSTVVGISAIESAARKKIKGKKAYGDPPPKRGK
jgi:hypothetical protein